PTDASTTARPGGTSEAGTIPYLNPEQAAGSTKVPEGPSHPVGPADEPGKAETSLLDQILAASRQAGGSGPDDFGRDNVEDIEEGTDEGIGPVALGEDVDEEDLDDEDFYDEDFDDEEDEEIGEEIDEEIDDIDIEEEDEDFDEDQDLDELDDDEDEDLDDDGD